MEQDTALCLEHSCCYYSTDGEPGAAGKEELSQAGSFLFQDCKALPHLKYGCPSPGKRGDLSGLPASLAVPFAKAAALDKMEQAICVVQYPEGRRGEAGLTLPEGQVYVAHSSP